MTTVKAHNYDKFRPHFVSVAALTADTSLSYTDSGNEFVVAENDYVGGGPSLYIVLASGAGSADLTTAGGVKLDLVGSSGGPGTVYVEEAGSAIVTASTINFLDGFTVVDGGGGDADVSANDSFIISVTDETSVIATGTSERTFRMPYAMTLTEVRASLNSATTTGTVTVDINEGGTTILSTKLTIDATEKTSTTAATAAVISDAALADDAEITIDIDDAGDGTATGLKVTFKGYIA